MNERIRTILRSLLRDLLDGRLSAGDKCPREIDLSKRFHAGRMDAHHAMKALESAGLVSRRKRVGTVVRRPVDLNAAKRLLGEASRRVLVLYSANPRHIHWDETSFSALEEVARSKGYVVDYAKIPESGVRGELESVFAAAAETGTSALVVFPDMTESSFLAENDDLISSSLVPVFTLNRSGEPSPFVNVSEVSMDPLGEGFEVGELLASLNKDVIAFVGGEPGQFWRDQRLRGLGLGLKCGLGAAAPPVERFVMENTAALNELTLRFADHTRWFAVVAVNNAAAADFIDFAADRGFHPPKDYQLIAFDDNPLHRSYDLTTMRQPFAEVGRVFGELIIDDAWARRHRGRVSVKVRSNLIERGSLIVPLKKPTA